LGVQFSTSDFFVHMLLHLSLHELIFREAALIEDLETAIYSFFIDAGIGIYIFTGGFFSRTCRTGFIIDADIYLQTMEFKVCHSFNLKAHSLF
jgi:hypothetical protein